MATVLAPTLKMRQADGIGGDDGRTNGRRKFGGIPAGDRVEDPSMDRQWRGLTENPLLLGGLRPPVGAAIGAFIGRLWDHESALVDIGNS